MTLVPTTVLARDLYLYETIGIEALSVEARALYVYETIGMEARSVLVRDLYAYEATRDLPVFPWLGKINPTQQYQGGQVELFGDGLGQFAEVGAGASVTASSTDGSNIPSNVASRTTAYWQSNDASPWLRFTFGGATNLYGIVLVDLLAGSNSWGIPLFRFSSGADVIGSAAVPIPTPSDQPPEYPVGNVRTLYVLPVERTCTWVEVRVSSGGAGASRGLSQAWILADDGVDTEPSTVTLNGEDSGTPGKWLNRSPGLWPANSGLPLEPAGQMVVPLDGTSGLVKVSQP